MMLTPWCPGKRCAAGVISWSQISYVAAAPGFTRCWITEVTTSGRGSPAAPPGGTAAPVRSWSICAASVRIEYPPDLFTTGVHDCPDCAGVLRLTRLPPLGQIEQQEFCCLTGMYLEHGLFTDSGPVTSSQQRAVELHRPANDLHPGMPVVAQAMGEFLSSC